MNTGPCDSCEVVNINGVRCHEHGCPDAWRDYAIECFECGCEFMPEARHARVCPGCVEDMERCGDEPTNTTTCAECGGDYPDRDMMPLKDGGELCQVCADGREHE